MPVTARVLFKSRYAIVTPGAPGHQRLAPDPRRGTARRAGGDGHHGDGRCARGLGLILRSEAAEADAEAIAADIAAMRDLAEAVLADAAGTSRNCWSTARTPHEAGLARLADPRPTPRGWAAGSRARMICMRIADLLRPTC